MNKDSTSNEIRKGLLVLAVLNVIGARKSYAGEILSVLNKTEFSTQEGTLYPMLSRLKREGYISHEWVESKNGPPRKYYYLSESGLAKSRELSNYIDKLQEQLKSLGGNRNE